MLVKYWLNVSEICGVSIATQPILVASHIWQLEVKERLKLYNLHIDHVVIRSELKYGIVARNVDFWGVGLVWKPGVAEIPDQEIAHGSFHRKLRKLRFRFEERREGVAAAR
jgi:hypothetical protein